MNIEMTTTRMSAAPSLYTQGTPTAREPQSVHEQPTLDQYVPEASEEEAGDESSTQSLIQSLGTLGSDAGTAEQVKTGGAEGSARPGSLDPTAEPSKVRISSLEPDMVAGPGGAYNPSTQKKLQGEVAGFSKSLNQGRPFVQLNDRPPVYGVITRSANGDLTVLMGPSAPKGVPSDFTVTGALRYEKTADGHLRRSFCSAERPWSCHLQTTRDGHLHSTMWPAGNGCIPQEVVQ